MWRINQWQGACSWLFVFYRGLLMESDKKGSPFLLLLSIPEAAKTLGLGRTKVYELIATEGLPVVRFGRAVRVPVNSLQQWIEQREKQELSA
jgi:excisionase family DNA binding protein